MRFGGCTTSISSYSDWSAAASRKKLRTPTSISHFALLKSMNGSDCRTCTSKRESIGKTGEVEPAAPAREFALVIRYSTTTRVDVSGTSVSNEVETSWM